MTPERKNNLLTIVLPFATRLCEKISDPLVAMLIKDHSESLYSALEDVSQIYPPTRKEALEILDDAFSQNEISLTMMIDKLTNDINDLERTAAKNPQGAQVLRNLYGFVRKFSELTQDAFRETFKEFPAWQNVFLVMTSDTETRDILQLITQAQHAWSNQVDFKSVSEFVKAVKKTRVRSPLKPKNAKPEASSDAECGNYLFASLRNDVPDEPNTDIESVLYHDVILHVNKNIALPIRSAQVLLHALENGWYSALIKPPVTDQVYRGVSVSEKFMHELLKLGIDESLSSRGHMSGQFTWTPRAMHGGTSWTTTYSIAQKFANASATRERPYALVMTADVSANTNHLVDMHDLHKHISILRRFISEREVIGLGKIKVSKIHWQFVG